MPTEAEIQKRIAEEQAKIDVPSYQDEVWISSWKRRAAATWGLGALATVAGAVTGLLAPLAPALFAQMPLSLPLIGQSIVIFSGLGLATGMTVGGMMGPSVGSATAAVREFERRQIAREVDQTIRNNPDASVTLVNNPALQKEEDREKNIQWRDYINVKTMLMFAAIGTVGGLIFAAALYASGGMAGGMAGHFLHSAAVALLGQSATSTAALTAYSAGIGAIFGAHFGVSYSRLTNQAVKLAGELLGGKPLGEPWPRRINYSEPKPVLSPVVQVQEKEEVPAVESKFADKANRMQNYQALITQAAQEPECGCNRRA